LYFYLSAENRYLLQHWEEEEAMHEIDEERCHSDILMASHACLLSINTPRIRQISWSKV